MKRLNTILLGVLSIYLMVACTNVNESVYDKYEANEFYATPEGSDVALAAVYAQVAGDWNGIGYAGADNGWYDMNMMSSDEQVIPHRNTGDWQLDFARLFKHEWLPTDLIINNTWNWLYKSIFNANLAVDQLVDADADPSKISEAKVLRAFFYYLLIDDYGSVPFYTKNDITVDQIPQASRKEIYDFIVNELVANVDLLSTEKGGDYYGRFNKWAGYTLLAKVYLNAEIYTGTPEWQACLDACETISKGGFSLHTAAQNTASPFESEYYDLFGDVLPGDETIFAMYASANIVSRNIYAVRSLFGAHGQAVFGYSGWNGTIVPTKYFLQYDEDDVRRKQFIYGEQPGGVNYSLNVTSLDDPGAAPQAGVRSLKFYPAGTMDGAGASNDFPIYRYADVILMQAECHVRLGNDAAAKPLVDAIRQRAGLDDLVNNPSLTDVYKERTFELNWEGHRRQDMIRFGTFLEPNEFRGASSEFRKLFPIPTSALNANPGLKQNTGY
tara:strand:+ start:9936 stop:11429 length:1494 start_codon:yes stop_codon:yes gene_type:complete